MKENRVTLQKSLSPIHVWALALGSIIGWGCFILPGGWLNDSGPMAAIIGIGLGALIMIVICASYGHMTKNFPVAGGEFAYAYGAFGRNHAFICGWMLTLGYLSIIPLNGTALAIIGKHMLPGVFAKGHLYTIAGWEVYLGEILLATFAILFFAVLNLRGASIMGKCQTFIALTLCAAVVLITASTLLNPNVSVSNLQPLFAPDKSAIAAIIPVLAIAPFLYVGFDTIPQSAEEFNFSPDKTFSLMFWSIIMGALLYMAMVFNTGIAMPYPELLASNPTWATGMATHILLGQIGMVLLAIAVTMAITSGINGFFMATSRMLFSMGRAKVLPSWFVEVHKTYLTPYNAIIFTMIVAAIAPWFGRKALAWIVDMAAIGTAAGYFYTCAAAYKYFQNNPDKGTQVNKIIAVLGALFSLGCACLLLFPGSPAALETPSWIALGIWVLLGAGFYMMKASEFQKIPENTLDHLILDNKTRGEFRGRQM